VTVGFVGLGNMGSALAANLVVAGHDVLAFDLAGPGRLPDGARFATSLADLAANAGIVILSLPDGKASAAVAEELVAAPGRSVTHVVDTSTVGVDAADAIGALLADAAIAYVDAPVSGGVAGARARTLMVMYAGAPEDCEWVEPVLAGLSDNRRRVGDRPAMAQALKLANNFLAATALAATSEAVAFGRSVGLDMATMLDVLNASSGRNSATADKFPNHVLAGSFSAGFANSLMTKDLRLYVESVAEWRAPDAVGRVIEDVWRRFADAEPGADFTRIFPFVEGRCG
jgi:3-hydroxyisobutyrate dehydrogenase